MTDIRRVLVVEDEPTENEFLALTARGLGFTADCAYDGAAALELAAKNKPSLVLLDALLPKIDGYAVLAELRQRMPDVPVVMMSGIYRKRTYEADALRMGATAYLVKPLSVVTVWELLERHLGTSDGTLPADFPGVPFWRRPLPAVVADLNAAKRTGLLFVRATGGAAILFFEDGNLIFARCNDQSTRLDRMLVASGRIQPDLLPRLAELVATSRGVRLGELLIQEGLASEDVVRDTLAEQQRVHLTRPFSWTEGACHFFPTDAPRRETFKMTVDVAALVFWGCRNLPVDDNLVKWLPRTDRKPRLTQAVGALAARLVLAPAEAEFLVLIDGTRTTGTLRSIARMLQVDGERMLAGLHALQLLDVPEGNASAAPTGMAGANVPSAGDVARFPPPLLLVTAALSRRTGVLRFESVDPPGQERTIWIEDGAIASASSNDPQDRLGQVLIREGLLSPEQLENALAAAQAKPGLALGRVVVDMRLLAPDDLHRGLVVQVQHAVNGLLGWRQGAFQFQERPLPVKDVIPLGLDTRQVLMDAFRRCPFADLATLLPPPETRLRRTTACHELASDLPLTALEDRLLLEVDGNCTVNELATGAPEGTEMALRAIQALVSMGLLEGFAGPTVARTERSSAEATAAPSMLTPTPPTTTGFPSLAPDNDSAFGGAGDQSFEGFGDAVGAGRSGQSTLGPAAPTPATTAPTRAASASTVTPGSPAAFIEMSGPPRKVPTPAASNEWESFGPATPATQDDMSFAGLGDASMPGIGGRGGVLGLGFSLNDAPPSPAATPSESLALSAGLADALSGGSGDWPAWEPGAGSGELSLDGGFEMATAPSTSGAATAVAERDAAVPSMMEMSVFFELLSSWLSSNPGTVPESVLCTLPLEVRRLFKL